MQMLEVQGRWTSSQLTYFHHNSTYDPEFTPLAFRSTFKKSNILRESCFHFLSIYKLVAMSVSIFVRGLDFKWIKAKIATFVE